MQAKIILNYENEMEAEAVADAISPDNIRIPPGLFVETTRKKDKVFSLIECKSRLRTFVATIDDLLSSVSIAEKSFMIAKKYDRPP